MKKQAHDPFAFGQVQLPKEPKQASVEDMLFSAPQGPADRTRDTSWDPPSAVDEPSFRDTPAAAEPQRSVGKAGAVQAPRPDAAVDATSRVDHAERSAKSDQPRNLVPPARPVVSAPSVATPSAGATLAEAAVPAVVLCACEAAAAWLWMSVGNPVLGALAALLGLGLAAFAWFAMRR